MEQEKIDLDSASIKLATHFSQYTLWEDILSDIQNNECLFPVNFQLTHFRSDVPTINTFPEKWKDIIEDGKNRSPQLSEISWSESFLRSSFLI